MIHPRLSAMVEVLRLDGRLGSSRGAVFEALAWKGVESYEFGGLFSDTPAEKKRWQKPR